jgi:hypothetical protein
VKPQLRKIPAFRDGTDRAVYLCAQGDSKSAPCSCISSAGDRLEGFSKPFSPALTYAKEAGALRLRAVTIGRTPFPYPQEDSSQFMLGHAHAEALGSNGIASGSEATARRHAGGRCILHDGSRQEKRDQPPVSAFDFIHGWTTVTSASPYQKFSDSHRGIHRPKIGAATNPDPFSDAVPPFAVEADSLRALPPAISR